MKSSYPSSLSASARPGSTRLRSSRLSPRRAPSPGARTSLAGIVGGKPSKSLSLAAGPAAGAQHLARLGQRQGLRSRERVSASFHPWEALLEIAHEEDRDLLVLEWPCYLSALQASAAQALTYPPCDLVLVRPPVPDAQASLLVPLRGGPSAELALRLSLAISDNQDARITTLHVLPKDEQRVQDAPFKGLAKVLAHLPEVEQRGLHGDDPAETILAQSRDYDLVVLGATAQPLESSVALVACLRAPVGGKPGRRDGG
jgi:glucosyl-3-phosphoglycerate synthase